VDLLARDTGREAEVEAVERLHDRKAGEPGEHLAGSSPARGHAVGRALMFAGRLAPSRHHLEEMLALYDPISHHSLVQQAAVDPQVGSLAHLGIVLYCLGFPDQALARSRAAVAEARRLDLPASLASSLSLGAILLSFVGDEGTLDNWVGQLVAVATEQGFPAWRAAGTIYCGWIKTKSGDVAVNLPTWLPSETAGAAFVDAAIDPGLATARPVPISG
jgi:hypothetical protein